MQMHDPKANSTRSSSTISASSSAVKLGYHSGGSGNNSQVTSSASSKASGSSGSNNNSTSNTSNTNNTNSKATDHNHQKRGKKKTTRDRQQPTKDDKSASAMSNLSSYSLIDDDHIDDQETINVGNLIIDLESDLEKEKIESEQANNNVSESNSKYSNISATNAPSSTSHIAISAPSSSTPSSSSATSNPSTPNKNSTATKSGPGQSEQNKSTIKQPNTQKSINKKDTVTNSTPNSSCLSNNGHNVSSRTVFKSSADERGELKMKITRETKPGKNEHKIVTSPNHKSPTSSSGGSTVNQEPSQYEHGSTFAQNTSNISSTRECGTSTSIGTITEPECLGPCEPGTSVTLEGIVWQETDGGILVVNVTWRGKTYVGALLDCTRHDMNWAPPRLCDSPASDIDAKTSKGNRAKRIVTRSNGISLDEKNLLQTTGKLRNGKGRRIPTSNEPAGCNKKQREISDKPMGESSTAEIDTNAQQADNMASTISENPCPPVSMDTSSNSTINNNNSNTQLESPQEPVNNLLDKTGPESPTLIGCNEPRCSKKYRNMNGLLYHQSHAHSAGNESTNIQSDCSTSRKDKETEEADECIPASDDRLGSGQSRMPTGSPPHSISQDDKLDQRQHFAQHQQGQKRERSSSPNVSPKFSNTFTTDPMQSLSSPHLGMSPRDHQRPRLNDSPRITAVKNVYQEIRNSSSPNQIGSVPRGLDHHGHKSSGMYPKHHSYEQQGHGSSSSSSNPQATTLSSSSSSKSISHSSKQANPQQPLPAPTEEGMKPSGTSTGPPPAPHQANCYFNPAFLANSFHPYSLPPYFPRHMYDPVTPPNIPTSNAAFLTRFMNNMRVPPPPDSPSRLLSPSIPKNVSFPPFKPDSGGIPPQIPTSHPLPNLSPMTNPPMAVPPLPPLSMSNIPPNIRMPSPSDVIMPPSSQPPPFLGLGSMMGIPGMLGNPLRPHLGGPSMPNLVDDPLAKHLPRRY